MAAGIDAAAMDGAIRAGGPVVGVLGCGPDRIYPAANKWLFGAMKDHCILSEYPPGTPPHKWNFPRRNRIISGLSSGVLVVEAPERSGSLITAHQAAEQGRDVFAVPGNVDLPGFAGSCQLLREGAAAVSSGWDVVCEYEPLYPGKLHRDMSSVPVTEPLRETPKPSKQPEKFREQAPAPKKDIDKAPSRPYIDLNEILPKLSEDERTLVEALRDGPRQADDVIAGTGLTTGKFLAAMTTLEIRGIVKRLPGKRVQLN
jgi:DNA processing protein